MHRAISGGRTRNEEVGTRVLLCVFFFVVGFIIFLTHSESRLFFSSFSVRSDARRAIKNIKIHKLAKWNFQFSRRCWRFWSRRNGSMPRSWKWEDRFSTTSWVWETGVTFEIFFFWEKIAKEQWIFLSKICRQSNSESTALSRLQCQCSGRREHLQSWTILSIANVLQRVSNLREWTFGEAAMRTRTHVELQQEHVRLGFQESLLQQTSTVLREWSKGRRWRRGELNLDLDLRNLH